jgi:hypothetical protein
MEQEFSNISSLHDVKGGTEYSTVVLDRTLQHHLHNGGIEWCQERLQQGNGTIASLKEAKRRALGWKWYSLIEQPNATRKIKLKQHKMVDCQVVHVRSEKWHEVFAQIRKVEVNRGEKGCGEENRFNNRDIQQYRDYIQYKKRNIYG